MSKTACSFLSKKRPPPSSLSPIRKIIMKKSFLSFLAIGALPLVGCFSADGAYTTTNRVPTVGQQLIDLQKAEQAGVITQEQFEAKKAELLKK